MYIGALTSPNPMLRCAAGEALGRMAQVVSDPKFVADTAAASFECLKSARDVISRTGHSLALGCLHRCGNRSEMNETVANFICPLSPQLCRRDGQLSAPAHLRVHPAGLGSGRGVARGPSLGTARAREFIFSAGLSLGQLWYTFLQALIADSGGPMFRSFVDPTVSTVLKLLLTVQANSLEVISCLGRVLSALITTLGPELQTGDEGGINGFYESIVEPF